jgi:hypothetical protein
MERGQVLFKIGFGLTKNKLSKPLHKKRLFQSLKQPFFCYPLKGKIWFYNPVSLSKSALLIMPLCDHVIFYINATQKRAYNLAVSLFYKTISLYQTDINHICMVVFNH